MRDHELSLQVCSSLSNYEHVTVNSFSFIRQTRARDTCCRQKATSESGANSAYFTRVGFGGRGELDKRRAAGARAHPFTAVAVGL